MPHAVIPDELQKNGKPANVIKVTDQMILRDDSGEVRLYNVANPHVDGMLIGHIVNDGLVWITDMYSPSRDQRKTAGSVNLCETLKRLRVVPRRLAGGHGGTAGYGEFEAIEK